MAVQYPSILANQGSDGPAYAESVVLPAAEVDLGKPLPLPYGQSLSVSVTFTPSGPIGSFSGYVVLQGSDDSGQTWFDLAWCNSSQVVGNDTYLLSVGAHTNNVVRQTRSLGTAPTPVNSANSVVLPGLIRFTGKGSITGASSSSSGVPGGAAQVAVTIRFHVQGLR